MRFRLVRVPLLAACAILALASASRAQVQAPALADPSSPLRLPPEFDPGSPGNMLRRTPTLAPVSPSSLTKTVLSLSAQFEEKGPSIKSGLQWRIFSDQPDVNGNHALVMETTDANPMMTLDPGGYICHVTYGLVGATRHIVLGSTALNERVDLNAGALRFTGSVAGKPIPNERLGFEVRRNNGAGGDELVAEVKAGVLLRLPAGSYQVTSTYGTANARIDSEVRVEPGKLTDAAVLHKAGTVDLRLLAPDGAEISDATWSILTPGGDVVSDGVQDQHSIVLEEGEYLAVARADGETVQKPFEVKAGQSERIELARN
ncbi:hypothetical protein [Terrihabitans rhizophilus]|jgi:hypothetical protein|uniref:Uncharacterized protein n=1 Tax=Terrihabitans rhizophilus TaxID=3092662 RepID=A0ABU4RRX8_9HYPH|nr:hypothetical protein [Terrihabitans sp. PJ23]MDX6807597.1 hypothetical protein [Terrihabitans sp. PJ23]